MGLTHYWKRPMELDADKFAAAVQDCAKVIPELGIPLTGEYEQPIFLPSRIAFNGAEGAQCELFKVSFNQPSRRQEAFTFSYCKTESLPYDICVRVALIILKHHLRDDFKVSSDSRNEKEWEKAKDICQSHLGYGADFLLES